MLENILLQTTTTATATGSDPLVNLIIALSMLLGTVGSIIGGLAALWAKRASGKAKEAAETIVDVAEFAVETGKQVVNNEDKIRGVATVIRALSPEEARKKLDEANITIEKLKEDVIRTTALLNQLGTHLPVDVAIDANHNGIPDRLEPVTKPDSVAGSNLDPTVNSKTTFP